MPRLYTDYEYDDLPSYGSGYLRGYAPYGPFRFLTLVMAAAAVILLCLCVACGLMYLSDFAEEYPSRARSILRALIAVNVIMHVAMMVVDRLSWWRSVLSLVANLLYLRLMRNFPFVKSFEDPMIIVTVVVVVAESAMWYWRMVALAYYTSFMTVLGFFVFLWAVPLGLLSSCVLAEDQLPGAGQRGGASGGVGFGAAAAPGGRGRRKTIVNSIVEFFKPPNE